MFLKKKDSEEEFHLSDFSKFCLLIISICVIFFGAVTFVNKMQKIDILETGNYEYIENGDF